MSPKILIAMDDSENAMRAVDHVAKTFSRDAAVIILSVLPDTATLCDLESPELTPLFKSQQSSFCQLEDKKRMLVQEACEKARQTLEAAGFDGARIEIRTQVKQRGVARDIVAAASSEKVDLIVLGKHGMAGIKEFFMGSVSQKVTQLAKDISVLIAS